jgi:myo-inositol-1-phosphate synthase
MAAGRPLQLTIGERLGGRKLIESRVTSRTVRVAIIGVGNCASSFVQGLSYYNQRVSNVLLPGLMHQSIGGYEPKDIVISAAFDVHAGKVGRDVSDAIQLSPNNTLTFSDVPHSGVTVQRGETLDGLGPSLRKVIDESDAPPVDVAGVLRASRTDVVVSYLPVGSQCASEYYAEQAMAAGCAYVNCIPVFLASKPEWRKRFEECGLPIIGDDIKSQVGATIVHRVLSNLCRERGVRIDRTYQLNFGGNTDFLNMQTAERLISKKISKTQSVVSQLNGSIEPRDVHVGPSDYVPWLEDRKIAHIRIEGTGFGGASINLELKLEVWDSPNSAGVVIDAVRCAKLALERGLAGAIQAPSGYFMKSPPIQVTDQEAREDLVQFIAGA